MENKEQFNMDVTSTENTKQMVIDFINNPTMAQAVRESSEFLLEIMDKNYFSKDIMGPEKELLKIISNNFAERDPINEVRIFKSEFALYTIFKTFEELGFISIIKQKNTEGQIKDLAQKIWGDFKKKKSVI